MLKNLHSFCPQVLVPVSTNLLLSSPEGTVFLYLTRQHYRKTVPEGEDNNMFSTYHLILDIKEKKTLR
jgi:hypothetical protein